MSSSLLPVQRVIQLALLAGCLTLVAGCQTGQPMSDEDAGVLPDTEMSEEERAEAELQAELARQAELLRQQVEAARREAEQKAINERYQQALEALKNKDYAIAEGLFSDLLSEQESFPFLTTNLGLSQLGQEKWQVSEDTFSRVVAADSDNAVAFNHMAIAQRRQGKFQDALASYQEALTIDPDYAAAHLNIAILFDIYLQDLPNALQHYETYLELHGKEDKLVTGWLTDLKRRLNKQ